MTNADRVQFFAMWLGIIAELDDNRWLWVVAGICFALSIAVARREDRP